MNPLNKREISKYRRKNPSDKKLWQNLWKRMVSQIATFAEEPHEKSWDEIYRAHLKW